MRYISFISSLLVSSTLISNSCYSGGCCSKGVVEDAERRPLVQPQAQPGRVPPPVVVGEGQQQYQGGGQPLAPGADVEGLPKG